MIEATINGATTIGGAEPALLAGRYRAVRQLGRGGMGSVWLAEDVVLDNHPVAIKTLPAILVANRRAYQQVKAEALVSLKLVHSNIVAVRAFEENGGNPFLVMDYIEGRTLDDYLAEKGTLSETETVKLLVPVAAALDYAHAQGVIHRDVKPGNVMVRSDGTPFVLDFGIARELQETMTRMTGKLSSGTLMYMSPEQLNGDRPAVAQDVYSFAAMVYECLTGEPPFCRGQIEWQIVNKAPAPLDDAIGIADTVLAGLAKTPDKRPATCALVLAGKEGRQVTSELRQDQPRNERKVTSDEADIYLVEAKAKDLFERKVAHASEPTDTALKDVLGQLRILYSAASNARQCGDSVVARRLYADFTQSVADYETAVAEAARKAEEARQAELTRQREEACKAEEVRKAELARQREEARKAEEARLAELARQREEARNAEEARQAELARQCEAEAKRWSGDGAKAGDVQEMTLPGGAKMKFVWCPPGTFTMGSPAGTKGWFSVKGAEEGRGDDEIQHWVTLTKGFWLGQYEVTQSQWRSVMGNNPSDFKGDDRPVENVSWEDCQEFIEKCNMAAKCVRFVLPTEAQWEYACRAGSTGPYAGTGCLDEMGWYNGNSGSETHPVGQKQPNAWNLYDMHGNVCEWCADWYGTYEGDSTDPTGPASGEGRVLRGGGWYGYARNCRSANRGGDGPGNRGNYGGFRLLCSAGPRE